jgi:hypothetical protein
MRRHAGWVFVCAACAHNVPQDLATGPDGKQSGAVPIKLDNGEGKAGGIVTYPGGDRVDWKLIELPAGKRGRLDLQMTFSTPRPGLQVAFDVFDEWNAPIVTAAKSKSKGHTRDATIDPAKGKYFIRVYAPKRGDAGTYKLAAVFTEEVKSKIPNPLDLQIPDPPKLADVPVYWPPCDTFDAQNPNCPKMCPASSPLVASGCPVQPGTTAPPPPTPPTPPPPPPVPKNPIAAPIKGVTVDGSDVEVLVLVGKTMGIDNTWKVKFRRSGATKTVTFPYTFKRVDNGQTILRVKMTAQDAHDYEIVFEP